MNNKITIVTGGNTGIGKATVAGLAQRGATVVIACRDVAKGNAARDEIAASAVHVMPLDLASLASVRALARRARRAPVDRDRAPRRPRRRPAPAAKPFAAVAVTD